MIERIVKLTADAADYFRTANNVGTNLKKLTDTTYSVELAANFESDDARKQLSKMLEDKNIDVQLRYSVVDALLEKQNEKLKGYFDFEDAIKNPESVQEYIDNIQDAILKAEDEGDVDALKRNLDIAYRALNEFKDRGIKIKKEVEQDLEDIIFDNASLADYEIPDGLLFNKGTIKKDLDLLKELKEEREKLLSLGAKPFNGSGDGLSDVTNKASDSVDKLNEKLNSKNKITIFDGFKEYVYDVNEDIDALMAKLEEMSGKMLNIGFHAGDLSKDKINSKDYLPGDSLKFNVERGRGSSPGTGTFFASNMLDVIDWLNKHKGVGFERNIYATDLSRYKNLLRIPNDDYYENITMLFEALHAFTVKDKFPKEGYAKQLKGITSGEDIYNKYSSIFNDLNIAKEQFLEWLTVAKQYVESFSSTADMSKSDAIGTKFLKDLTPFRGIDASMTSMNDSVALGSLVFTLDKDHPFDIDFGQNEDIAKKFFEMIREKLLSSKATNNASDIDDILRSYFGEDEQIDEAIKNRLLEIQKKNGRNYSFSDLNNQGSSGGTDVDDELSRVAGSAKDAEEYINSVKKMVEDLTGALDKTYETMNKTSEALKSLTDFKIEESSLGSIGDVADNLRKSLESLDTIIKENVQPIFDKVGEKQEVELGFKQESIDKMHETLNDLYDSLKTTPLEIENVHFAESVASQLQNDLTDLAKGLKLTIDSVDVSGATNKTVQQVSDGFNNVLSRMLYEWQKSDEDLRERYGDSHLRERSAVVGADGIIYGAYSYGDHDSTGAKYPALRRMKEMGVSPIAALHSHGKDNFVAMSMANDDLGSGDLSSFYSQYHNYKIPLQITVAGKNIEVFNAKKFYDDYGKKGYTFELGNPVFDEIYRSEENALDKYTDQKWADFLIPLIDEYGNGFEKSVQNLVTEIQSAFGMPIENFNSHMLDMFKKDLVYDYSITGDFSRSMRNIMRAYMGINIDGSMLNLKISDDYISKLFGVQDLDLDRDLFTYGLNKIRQKEIFDPLKINLDDYIETWNKDEFISKNPIGLPENVLNGISQNSSGFLGDEFVKSYKKSIEELKDELIYFYGFLDEIFSGNENFIDPKTGETFANSIWSINSALESLGSNSDSVNKSLNDLLSIIMQLHGIRFNEDIYEGFDLQGVGDLIEKIRSTEDYFDLSKSERIIEKILDGSKEINGESFSYFGFADEDSIGEAKKLIDFLKKNDSLDYLPDELKGQRFDFGESILKPITANIDTSSLDKINESLSTMLDLIMQISGVKFNPDFYEGFDINKISDFLKRWENADDKTIFNDDEFALGRAADYYTYRGTDYRDRAKSIVDNYFTKNALYDELKGDRFIASGEGIGLNLDSINIDDSKLSQLKELITEIRSFRTSLANGIDVNISEDNSKIEFLQRLAKAISEVVEAINSFNSSDTSLKMSFSNQADSEQIYTSLTEILESFIAFSELTKEANPDISLFENIKSDKIATELTEILESFIAFSELASEIKIDDDSIVKSIDHIVSKTSEIKELVDTLKNLQIYIGNNNNIRIGKQTQGKTDANISGLNTAQRQLKFLDSLQTQNYTQPFLNQVAKVRSEYEKLINDINSKKIDLNIDDTPLKNLESQIEWIRKAKDSLNFKIANQNSITKLDANIASFQSRLKGNSEYIAELQQLRDALRNVANRGEFDSIAQKFNEIRSAATDAGDIGSTVFERLGNRIMQMNTNFISMYFSFYDIIRYIREGVDVIKEYDTALTEMRKVSDYSTNTLKAYQQTTFDTGNALGATALQIQNSTADFMRLGESLDEASKSAEAANLLMNVSEFSDISAATDSLIAMSAAYSDIEKENIVDKMNEIGNKLPIHMVTCDGCIKLKSSYIG